MKFWGGEYYEDKLSVVEYIYPLGGGGRKHMTMIHLRKSWHKYWSIREWKLRKMKHMVVSYPSLEQQENGTITVDMIKRMVWIIHRSYRNGTGNLKRFENGTR